MAGGSVGRPDWTATETLCAAWLLPKEPASIFLRCLLRLLRCRSLLLLFAPSSSCSLFPSCISHSVPLFISLRSCSSPGPLQTLSGELRVGGGRPRRRDEEIEQDKSAEMQLRGWLSKEAGRCLYAACERTDRADSLFYPRPSAEACLGQRQHIHPLVHLHQASLRWDVGCLWKWARKPKAHG